MRTFDPETWATLREAFLLPLDLAPVVPDASPGDDVIVLIHGFMATGGVFRPMRAKLESYAGVRAATFTHPPGWTVPRIARALADIVDRLPRDARVHLVGHSLGGVVARWYVQELGGHARVTQTFSLASPFWGSPMARRFPWFVGAELHDASALLSRLRARAHHVGVPHTSIIAGADRLVVPRESAAFPASEVHVLPGLGHNGLLFDDAVVGILVERLSAVRDAAA